MPALSFRFLSISYKERHRKIREDVIHHSEANQCDGVYPQMTADLQLSKYLKEEKVLLEKGR